MKYIVKIRGVAGSNEIFWYLKATTWTSELQRADAFNTQQEAQQALARAGKFMKASMRRAAVVTPIDEATLVRCVAEALHKEAPGTWIETDQTITKILATRPATEDQPHGGVWWRTHHLIRQLGGRA